MLWCPGALYSAFLYPQVDEGVSWRTQFNLVSASVCVDSLGVSSSSSSSCPCPPTVPHSSRQTCRNYPIYTMIDYLFVFGTGVQHGHGAISHRGEKGSPEPRTKPHTSVVHAVPSMGSPSLSDLPFRFGLGHVHEAKRGHPGRKGRKSPKKILSPDLDSRESA